MSVAQLAGIFPQRSQIAIVIRTKTSSCCVTGATFEHGECIGEERQNADAFDVLRKR